MKKLTYLSIVLLAPFVGAGTSHAGVYFQDNFEGKTNPTDNPQIGQPYSTTGSVNPAQAFFLSTNPAIGTQSLELQRNAVFTPTTPLTNPTLIATGLNGALADGNNIQFSWDSYITYKYNAPVQVAIGYDNGAYGTQLSGSEMLAFVGVNDGTGGGAYFYQDASGAQDYPGNVKATLNQWDHMRVVLHLSEFYGGGGQPNYMTGTMDYYVTPNEFNGGVEQALVLGAQLPYVQIPTESSGDMSLGIDDTTAPVMQFQKGYATTGQQNYYDNLSIQDLSVPEPASMGGLLVCSSVGLFRRARKSRS
jgi:hypothetical protein